MLSELIALQELDRAVAGASYQARWLTPGKFAACGVALIALGIGLFFDARGRALPPVPWIVMVIGAMALVTAVRRQRAVRRRSAELALLDARWPELAAGMAAAAAAGQSPVRYLRSVGITDFEVRQVALRRHRGEQPRSAPTRRDVAAAGPAAAFLPKHARPQPPQAPTPHWLPKG